MIRPISVFVIILYSLTGLSFSKSVQQSPSTLLTDPGESVQLNCSHNIQNYDTILWYQQPQQGNGMKLLGRVTYKNVEMEGEKGFNMSGDGKRQAFLHIDRLALTDSAVYLCAAWLAGHYEATFGPGTKLTVLESGIEIRRPKVKVLPPSIREGCEKKKTNRTLVCVATGFYPDHITVSWKLNGVEVTSGVRTDDTALRDEDNKFYSITSRLRVSYRKWFDTRSTFTCLTSFYNGKISVEDKDSIKGVNGGGMDREYLLKSGLTAKLSYSVFIAKSFLYGLFVSAVVWKIRSSAAKRYE